MADLTFSYIYSIIVDGNIDSTAFLINKEGFLLSTGHQFRDKDEGYECIITRGGYEFKAELIYNGFIKEKEECFEDYDFSILQIKDSRFKPENFVFPKLHITEPDNRKFEGRGFGIPRKHYPNSPDKFSPFRGTFSDDQGIYRICNADSSIRKVAHGDSGAPIFIYEENISKLDRVIGINVAKYKYGKDYKKKHTEFFTLLISTIYNYLKKNGSKYAKIFRSVMSEEEFIEKMNEFDVSAVISAGRAMHGVLSSKFPDTKHRLTHLYKVLRNHESGFEKGYQELRSYITKISENANF